MRYTIKYILLVYFCAGFAIGSLESLMIRTDQTYDAKEQKVIDTSRSGCIYKSVSSLLNPGHIIACELFRRRFEVEGFSKYENK
jgi:hypothetical protein